MKVPEQGNLLNQTAQAGYVTSALQRKAATQTNLANDINNSPRMQQQRGVLQGMFAQPVAQLATSIAHGPTKNISASGVSWDVGTKMTATLDPSDPQLGSRVASEISSPLQVATASTKRRYVQGHLLNNRIGGTGSDTKNLTPLTYSANSSHYNSVEKTVISEWDAGKTVQYEVEADYSGTPRATSTDTEHDIETLFASKLKCKWNPGGTGWVTHDVDNVPPYPSNA